MALTLARATASGALAFVTFVSELRAHVVRNVQYSKARSMDL